MKEHLVYTSTDVPALVQQRLIRYFESAGYKTTKTGQTLVFRRGSFVAGVFSFSSKSWSSVVTASVAPAADGSTTATIGYDVNTTGQTITPGEAAFWVAEVAGAQRTVVEGVFDPGQSERSVQAAVSGNWVFLRQMLLGGLISIVLILPLIPVFALALKVAIPLARWIMRLVPRVGTDVAGVLLVLAFLALLATVLFVQEWSQVWSRWIAHRLPPKTPSLVLTGVNLALYAVLLAIGFTLFYAIFAVLGNLHSPNEMIWWVLFLVGPFVLAFLADRREKKKRG